MWNFFRLENEHLNNCGKFRAVRDISVAPMDASDQAAIIKMMDEPDGVVNRRARKKANHPPSAPSAKSSTATIVNRKEPAVRFLNAKKSAPASALEETSEDKC